VRIPTLDNQTRGLSPLSPARPQYTPDTRAESLAGALSDVNRVGQKIREEERLKADQAAFMEADRVLGENENSILNDPTTGALSYRGKDAMDIAPKALEEFDLAASKAQTNLKTERQRLAFGQSLQDRRQAIERTLMQHESREREEYYATEREAYKQSAQSSAITNFRDPARIEQEIDKVRATLDQTPGLSREQRDVELSDRRSAVYGGVIDRYLSNEDVGAAEKYYGAIRERVNGETASNIERALRIAKDRQEAKRESGLSLARAELTSQVQDIEATFRSRLPVESVPPVTQFVAAFGAERGRKMHDQVRLMADASLDAAKLTQMSTDQVMRVAAGYAPTQQQGAAVRAEIAGIIQQQAATDLREREADPVGYLVRHSPSVQATWKDLANGTGDADRYVTSVRGEQERLGLPPGDLLPDDYAAEVAARIANAEAEGMVGMIRTEADRWGTAWPEVYGQLAPKMTDVAAVIGSGIPTHAADALASTAALKTTELQAMIPSGTTKKDIDEEISSQLDEFNQSFPVDAARTVSAFNDAATRLAIRYMQQGSGSASAAVKKAVADLTGNYSFVRNSTRDVTYRVPAQYDSSTIEEGADETLRKFYVSSSGIDLGISQTHNEEEIKAQFNDYVHENGYWMTTPDESGLRLYVDGGPLVTDDGPVQYTWDQITTIGMQHRGERQKLMRESEADQDRARREGLR